MQQTFAPYLKTLFWLIAGILILFGSGISTFASIGVIIVSIFSLRVFSIHGVVPLLKSEPAILLFAIAFLILSAAMLTRHPVASEAIYIANFLPLALAIPVYVTARLICNMKLAQAIAFLCLAGTFIAIGVGLYDVQIRHVLRAEGFYTGALIYARMSVLFGFTAAIGIFLFKGWSKAIFIMGPILTIFACVLAGARGVLIAVPFLMLWLFVILAMDKTLKAKWWIFGGIIVVAIIGFFVALMSPSGPRILSTLSTISAVFGGDGSIGSSARFRLIYIEEGWQYFLEKPLFGYGWNQLDELSNAALIEHGKSGTPQLPQFHNDFINFSVAFGLAGVVAWLLLLATPIVGALFSPRDNLFLARLYGGGVLSILYALSGLTDIALGYDMPTTAYAILTAIILGGIRERPYSGSTPPGGG